MGYLAWLSHKGWIWGLLPWGEGYWGESREAEVGVLSLLHPLPACRCRQRAHWLPCRSMGAAGEASGALPHASCCPSEQPVAEREG